MNVPGNHAVGSVAGLYLYINDTGVLASSRWMLGNGQFKPNGKRQPILGHSI